MDLLKLENKVAIVTGGASGIGDSVVNRFTNLGMKVVIADLDEEKGEALELSLVEKEKECFFHQLDVSQSDQVTTLVKETLERFQTIDILVNCAGVGGLSSYLDLIEEEWDWTLNTNLKGTHLMCYSVGHVMVEKGVKGRIVNVSSINDEIPVVGLAAYATSKAGISGLTRALALEFAPFGINVNAIRPGTIVTPLMKEPLELPDLAHALIRQIPRGRFGHPEDVSKVITFLVSDLGEWVTGAVIPVTGGMHLVGEASLYYYFEREMRHEEQLPDIPFTRPWKQYNLSDFYKKQDGD
ncbi:MAG: SDR family NAD(P)-dependent oxidoreductase [Candidatus Hodarchaeales archaeon]|jgi:NAD(P)-dependent dehydrogenase (short-subunit alcohol dehydrogenase family)